jgi:hypothetical protein
MMVLQLAKAEAELVTIEQIVTTELLTQAAEAEVARMKLVQAVTGVPVKFV